MDHRRVLVCGGRGGDGVSCFHSEPRKEFGGPDGGDGGSGGHVILRGMCCEGPWGEECCVCLPLGQGLSLFSSSWEFEFKNQWMDIIFIKLCGCSHLNNAPKPTSVVGFVQFRNTSSFTLRDSSVLGWGAKGGSVSLSLRAGARVLGKRTNVVSSHDTRK